MVFTSICKHACSSFIFASTSHSQFCHASSEHFVNFPPAGMSLLLKHCFAPSNLADTPSKHHNRRKARQHVKILSRFNHSQKLTANYALFNTVASQLLQAINFIGDDRVAALYNLLDKDNSLIKVRHQTFKRSL